MKATIATLIFLSIMTTVFAQEPKVFTDTDLEKYKSSQDEETAKQLESDRISWEKQKAIEEKQKAIEEKQKAIENTTSTKDSPQEKPKVEEELNCYSFHPPGSPYTWEHCKDKSGKIVRKRKI